jgi:RNA polymerase primary sigma factor
MSTHADDAVVDPWVVLRRLVEENRALRAERDELRDRVDELELRLAQQPTMVAVHEDRPVLGPVAERRTPEAVDDLGAPATGDDGAVPALPDISALLRPWQRDALAAWQAAGRRGVVEAVTGAGKTFVGICATRDAVAAGGRALVLVPTRELQEQWVRVLVEQLPDVAVGRLGGGRQDELAECDVLVAIVHSAAARSLRPRPGDVLVADECHRYGAPTFAQALEDGFEHRLGLTATYEREDDGVATHLRPFFGDVVFTLWYDRALADGVIAPFDIALGAVQLTPEEQQRYDDCGERMEKAARNLEWRHGIARQPYEQFMAQVSRVARGERSDPLSIAARA